MNNLEANVNNTRKALDGAEAELKNVGQLAEVARAAKEAAEAAYDNDPSPEHGRRTLAARQEAELAGVREERASRRVEVARESLGTALAEQFAEQERVEAERRSEQLADATRRASAATLRAEAAEDIARFLELEKERRAIAARLEARVEAAQEAACEARALGASISSIADRAAEGLLLHRLMVGMSSAEETREWAVMGTSLYPLFSAWKKKAESNASIFFHRGPFDHRHALAAAFPELYATADTVSSVSPWAVRQVARLEAGEPVDVDEERGVK